MDIVEKSPALTTNGTANDVHYPVKPMNDLVAAVKLRSGTVSSVTSKSSVYSQNIGFEHHSSNKNVSSCECV